MPPQKRSTRVSEAVAEVLWPSVLESSTAIEVARCLSMETGLKGAVIRGAVDQSTVWLMRCPDWNGAKKVIDDTKLVGQEQPKPEAQES